MEAVVVICDAESYVTDVRQPYGFQMTVAAGPLPELGYVSHAVLMQFHRPPRAAPAVGRGATRSPQITVAAPEQAPERAEVGERFVGGATGGLRVREGSELVAPAAYSEAWFALLRITGDPRAVLEGYVEDVAQYVDALPGEVLEMPGARVGGFDVIRRDVAVLAGGSRTELTLCVPVSADEESWLVIKHMRG